MIVTVLKEGDLIHYWRGAFLLGDTTFCGRGVHFDPP